MKIADIGFVLLALCAVATVIMVIAVGFDAHV
jgi:multisubunit Na+/H+ antiporter MnhB subunit